MRRIAATLLFLVVVAAATWLFVNYDFSMLLKLSAPTLTLLIFLSLAYSLIYGVGVAWILRGLGARRSAWRVFLVICAGGTASYLGNVQLGVPLRLLLFNKLLTVSYPQGTAAVALESACWFGLMGLGLLLAGTASNVAPWILVSSLLLAVVLAYRLVVPALRGLLSRIPDKAGRFSLRWLRGFLSELTSALEIMRWNWLAATLMLFSVNYVIDAVSIAMVVKDLGQQIALLDALQAVILSYLAGLVSLIPMGLGVRDVSLVVLLERAGVSRDVASTVAVVQRALRTLLPLALGLLAVHLLGVRQLLGRQDSGSR